MLSMFVRRLGALVVVLMGLVVITFAITYAVPADPARVAVGLEAGPEQVEAYRKKMGLDQPIPVQFWRYVRGLLQGDLGHSIATRRSVLEDVKVFAAASAELGLVSMALYVVVGIPLGILAGLQHDKWPDYLARFVSVLGLAIPSFVLGLLLQLIFARWLGWFPMEGRLDLTTSPPRQVTGFFTIDALLQGQWSTFGNALWHLTLPTVAIAAGRVAVAARFMRSGLVEIMSEDYIRTARAKGLPERLILSRHALKNAMIPVITVLGLQFGYILGGIVLVEVIFSWPGLGRYAVTSIFFFDFPSVMGTVLVMGAVYVLVNFLVDATYRYLDPRVRG